MALVEVILFVLAFTQTTQANGVVEIKAVRYSATCTDNWILRTPCDTFFEFCLKKSTGRSDALQPCDYGSYGPTNHYDDTNNIDFTTRTSFAGGISNPLKFEVRSFDNFDIKIVISVRDDEAKGSEHLAWLAKEFRHSPAKTEQLSSWSETLTASSGNYRFQFKFRSYCIANYYTSSCNVYCLAQDNASGHYTCNQTTGAKVCMPGWTGPACDIDIDECAQGICHNGANCTNLPGSYKCECPENFVGKKCDLVYSLCYSKPCLNNGNCTGTTSSFNCTCNANWTGDTCQTMVNFCQSLPCLHGATCDAIVGAYSCRCAKGWTGENCQTEVDACRISPCLNNGTCQKEAGGEYTCRCSADYWGTNCEKYLDPCLSSPCNPGTCVRLTHSEFKCTCPVDYQGPTCAQYVDLCQSSPCQNAGTCTRLAHDSIRCTCTVDYRGLMCEEYIDPCQSRPCLNGGTCTRPDHNKYKCTCPVDYTGDDCNEYVDPCSSLPCLNSGTCVRLRFNHYVCNCTEDYTDRVCDRYVDPCESVTCLNAGTCVRVAFDEYRCNCTESYTGNTCDEYIDTCSSHPCLHSGTCVRLAYDGYRCRCTEGYRGSICDEYVDTCNAVPCLNSGTCVPLDFMDYRCMCAAGYTGKNCSDAMAPVAGSQTATLQDDKTLDPVPIVLAVCGSFLLVVIIVVVLLIVRRRRKKMETADVAHFSIREVHCESDPSVAFDNDLYRHVNTANACLDESRRQKQDVAHPPGCEDDVCNPATPLDEEMGAVGGVEHAYQDIDSCKVLLLKGGGRKEEAETSLKKASPAGQSSDAGVGTFGQAQSDERVRGNPYEDFEELKRQSRVQRSQEEASLNSSWRQGRPEVVTQPENPYHDLDEVRLEVEAMQSHILYSIPRPTAAQPPPLPPLPPALAAREIALQTNGDDEVTRGEGDDSSDDGEEEAVEQEDINQLRQEVLLARGRGKSDATSKC